MEERQKREFDFKRYKRRYVALKILYFGWDCDGLAAQLDNSNTIEYHLFNALIKTRLVESRDKCNYNRCGRTDKGVSSSGQVVNLTLRSNLLDETKPENHGLFTPEEYIGGLERNSITEPQEIQYVHILNRVLPKHIRVLAWAPVSKDFSSRFSCTSRSYSYIFPAGDLCIQSMREGLAYIVGKHDFRNLCSFDLKHGVINHKRTILSSSIECLYDYEEGRQDYRFYEAIITGEAFLYHQIRCIMTVLFLVGTRKEKPEVFRDLLDINKCPARPNYNRASPKPLCLFNCTYQPADMPCGWIHDKNCLVNLVRNLKNLWWEYKTKTTMIEEVLFGLEEKLDGEPYKRQKTEPGSSWKDFGLECDNMSDNRYTPLLDRPKDDSLEVKLESLKNKG